MIEPPAEFLNHVQALPTYASQNLSEADTRVYLIDPVLRLLGYTTVGDLRREVPVPATREFIDYELYAGGKAQAILEAKAVRLPVTDAAAAQCVQYASILGVRWCLVTNGVTWAIYNAHAAGALPEKRVATVRLDGSEDEVLEAWEVLRLFSRESLASANPLSRLLAERVVADELSNPDSQAVQALRRAVRSRFGERISGQAVVEIIDKLMGRTRRGSVTANGTGSQAKSDAPVPPQGASAAVHPAATAAENGAGTPAGKRKVNLPLKPDGSRVTIADLVGAGLLRVGDRLTIQIGSSSGEGFVLPNGIQVNGQAYTNPTIALRAVRDTSANGWDYWMYGDRTLADIRAEYLRRLTGGA
jgi:hypothetical protein